MFAESRLPGFTPRIFILPLALFLSFPGQAWPDTPLTNEEVKEIAVEAYLYAYPLVIMDVTRQVSTNCAVPDGGKLCAPMNQFGHAAAFPDATFTDVVRPNADTLYSTLWFDVTREPLIIHVPYSGGRYYLLPMLDMWSDVFASPGKRTTGTGGQTFAIVGPRWDGKLPKGVEPIRSPTGIGWMIGRTQANGKADFADVHKFQAKLKAVPLSAWNKNYKPSKGTVDPKVSSDPPTEQVARMDAGEFFARFAALTEDNPPHAHDYPILARMKRIGIEPGKPFDISRAPPQVQTALKNAKPIVLKKLKGGLASAGTVVNNWGMILSPIGTYGTDYLRRALIAYGGLGANVIEDAIYPTAFADAEGKAFDSGKKYLVHFEKGQIPPVRAFWSLTMYDDKQAFADNPLDRYAIGDRDPLKFNDDGSLTLYIQRDSPGKDRESNWLPAPKSGGFSMNLRLYWPKGEALDGNWKPPVVKRTDRGSTLHFKKNVEKGERGGAKGKTAPSSRYMGGPAKLATAPNGAIVNQEVLEQLPKTAWTKGPEIENPAKGVYVLGGYLISACIVVEAEDGLIVFDTGDTKKDGEHLLKAIRTFSDKPVKAIVYGHSHYCFGAGVLAEGNKDVMVIGHPNLNAVVAENLTGGGATAFYPEIGPLLTARALQQFNYYLPDKGPDAWFSPTNLSAGELAFLPVNRPVKDGEVLDVLGIQMQFFTKYGTDDKVHTNAWLPERKICIQNALWSTPPNLYSIRGDVYRDPREWYNCVKVVRDLEPEVLVGYGHRPIVGKAKIRQTLNNYLDGISFVLDQTLRGILAGYGPEDLRHKVKMPDYLAADAHNFQSYGELSFQSPAIFYYAVGWYDGDAATIFRPSPKEEAERLVKLIGGEEKVMAAAKAAFDRKEYAWAAQLVNYVYRLHPQDKEARSFKARVLRQLAYLSTGANARSHLLTACRALEGKVAVPRLIPPSPKVIAEHPETFVNYHRVRLDPKKSGKTDKVLQFEFTGNNKTVGMHIRRAVAEFLSDPEGHYKKADIVLSVSGETWAKLYLNSAKLPDLVKKGHIEIRRGTVQEATEVLDFFDEYRPEAAVLVRPHLHD